MNAFRMYVFLCFYCECVRAMYTCIETAVWFSLTHFNQLHIAICLAFNCDFTEIGMKKEEDKDRC